MAECCKDTKYNLLLKFEDWQKNDINFQNKTIQSLQEVMSWSEQKAKTTVEFAVIRGFCLIDSFITEDLKKMSTRFAEKLIPHEVKKSKK